MPQADFIPVSYHLQQWAESTSALCIGSNLKFSISSLEQEGKKIVFFSMSSSNGEEFFSFRERFYALKLGDWAVPIFDLGHFTFNDDNESFEEYKHWIEHFFSEDVVVVVISDKASYAHPQAKAILELYPSHFSFVDPKGALDEVSKTLGKENYISQLIQSEYQEIHHVSLLGYQSYYASLEELSQLKRLNYDTVRLGEITASLNILEPYLRTIDGLFLNLSSMENAVFSSCHENLPNGFGSREICELTQYAGLGNGTKFFALNDYKFKGSSGLDEELLSQMIWYFVEGVNNRQYDPFSPSSDVYEKYTVLFDHEDCVFYKNIQNDRWWYLLDGKKQILVPCHFNDYHRLKLGMPTDYFRNLVKRSLDL